MGRSKSQKGKLASELRDLVFRLSAIAGTGGALLYGLHHPPTPGRCPLHDHAQSALAHCISRSLGDAVVAWGELIAIGMIAGCIVGVLLALLIPGPRSRAARARS
jgi:hypothetical protein